MVDVLLFMGQSNMQGQCEKLCEPNDPVPNAFEYRHLTDELVPLISPAGEDIRYDGEIRKADWSDFSAVLRDYGLLSSVYGTTNMAAAFCRAYAEKTGHKVVCIHAAKGSTTVADWLPGTANYGLLCRKADTFFEGKGKSLGIENVYVVWLQGESDGIYHTTTEEYKARLMLLKDALKQRYGVRYFGIIKVGRFSGPEKDQPIFDAQEQLCTEEKDFIMLTRITERLVDLPAYMNPKAMGHFSSDGQELLGLTAGANLGRIIQGKPIKDPEL